MPDSQNAPLPTLIVVSGRPGTGKTTLAHLLARRIGCPAVCRDEIKEGMVHATPGFEPAPSDELTLRTLPTFFSVLRLLLAAGVTTVAEAAFQDRIWRPHLKPLLPLAVLRVVHCDVADAVAADRKHRRAAAEPTRRAHADGHVVPGFVAISLDVPRIEVDTTDGYAPGLDEVIAFVSR